LQSVKKDVIADILLHFDAINATQAAMKTDDLKKLMNTMAEEMAEMRKVNEKLLNELVRLDRMEEELQALKEENSELGQSRETIRKLEQRVAELEGTIQTQNEEGRKILGQQQKFLEEIDCKERGRNLILVGLAEHESEEQDRVDTKAILDALEYKENYDIVRLGKKEENKTRALLVIVTSKSARDSLVTKARTCQNRALKDIRVKRDMHPALRNEWSRLFRIKEEEEKKPENAHAPIVMDFKKRQVKHGDRVLASWNPVF
jgi:hypothetical protein